MTAITIRSLEQRVGEEVGVSPWFEITQERIDTSRRRSTTSSGSTSIASAPGIRRSAAPSRMVS